MIHWLSAFFFFGLLYLLLPAGIGIELLFFAIDKSVLMSKKRVFPLLSFTWLLPVSIHGILFVRLERFFVLSVYATPVPSSELLGFYEFITQGSHPLRTLSVLIIGLFLFFVNRKILLKTFTPS